MFKPSEVTSEKYEPPLDVATFIALSQLSTVDNTEETKVTTSPMQPWTLLAARVSDSCAVINTER